MNDEIPKPIREFRDAVEAACAPKPEPSERRTFGIAALLGTLSTSDLLGCGVCGGKMVFVRGRYPGTDNRKVCPTCLADRMDMIQELTSAEYGQAHEAHPNSKDEPDGQST
jgi:hypothetical protein